MLEISNCKDEEKIEFDLKLDFESLSSQKSNCKESDYEHSKKRRLNSIGFGSDREINIYLDNIRKKSSFFENLDDARKKTLFLDV